SDETNAMNPVLTLDRLTLCYGPTVAVDDLSLDIQPGEVFGLLGPNGSGKSTTLAAIVGAHPPSGGRLRAGGCLSAHARRGSRRRRLGSVPRELAVSDDRGGGQPVLFPARLYGLSGRDLERRTDEVLTFVRLQEYSDRPVRTFSGGMQRRINLACALAHRPRL